MVLVPADSFWMGCAPADPDCRDDEKPRHEVHLDAFFIDVKEVTVQAYRRCSSAGRCDPPHTGTYCNYGNSERASHPVNCVRYDQAAGYCRWAAKRLPTEAEWEKAARGTDGRIYPWGNQPPSCRLAIMMDEGQGCGRDSSWPVGSRPADKSPYGALDMAGNVWEWVSDWHDEGYYAHSAGRNPTGPTAGSLRVYRGGSWGFSHDESLRTSARGKFAPSRSAAQPSEHARPIAWSSRAGARPRPVR